MYKRIEQQAPQIDKYVNKLLEDGTFTKDDIDEHYPEVHRSYVRLRAAVKEAWDSIGADLLQSLLNSMPGRLQAVIDAQGGHIHG